jgi:hypothetical protein
MKKRYKIILGISILLVAAYFAGPKPKKPIYSEAPIKVPELNELENYIKTIESEHKIKPGNEAEIFWAYSIHTQT